MVVFGDRPVHFGTERALGLGGEGLVSDLIYVYRPQRVLLHGLLGSRAGPQVRVAPAIIAGLRDDPRRNARRPCADVRRSRLHYGSASGVDPVWSHLHARRQEVHRDWVSAHLDNGIQLSVNELVKLRDSLSD